MLSGAKRKCKQYKREEILHAGVNPAFYTNAGKSLCDRATVCGPSAFVKKSRKANVERTDRIWVGKRI